MVIKVKYFTDIQKIEKISKGDWIDLRAAKDMVLEAGDYACIPLGVAMELPKGYEAHVVPRSSTFKKWGILQTNSMGIIDNSYCGDNDEWAMPVYAVRTTQIRKGDRICQFRIMKSMATLEVEEVEHLDNENRSGFGSTGDK